MTKSRLEAFSDGVLAIIITIMVLELKVPHSDSLSALVPLWPVFVSYVLSFVYIGIYWSNHHNMMHAAHKVNGAVLWHNLHLLFWLSLVPFVTGWMGENHFGSVPVTIYGVVMLMSGVAYYFLANCLKKLHGHDSEFANALAGGWKEIVSILLYFAGIVVSFWNWGIGFALYIMVAIIWFVPDKRFENGEK